MSRWHAIGEHGRPDRAGRRRRPTRIPTDAPESDGTYRLGHDDAGPRRGRRPAGETGLGYTYADTATARWSATARRRRSSRPRRHATSRRLGRRWSRRSATSAGPGIALDGDLGRRRGALGPEGPAARPAARHAARGGPRRGPGLRQRRVHLVLRSSSSSDQLGGWVAAGIPRVKMKVGTRARTPTSPGSRAAREAIGADAELFVDANGAYARKQALALAERVRRRWA